MIPYLNPRAVVRNQRAHAQFLERVEKTRAWLERSGGIAKSAAFNPKYGAEIRVLIEQGKAKFVDDRLVYIGRAS